MQKRYRVSLDEAERAALRTLVSSGTGSAALLTHARILLKANQGEGGPAWTDAAIAGALEVGLSTVARVRQAYARLGLEAALARRASTRVYERKLDGAQEARLVALTCSAPPAGQKRWTLQLLAAQLVTLEVVETISAETVRQTLKQTR